MYYIEDREDSAPKPRSQIDLKTFATMRAFIDENKPMESAEVISDELYAADPLSGSESSSSGARKTTRGHLDQCTDEERMWNLCMGHELTLQAIKRYLYQGMLPKFGRYMVDCEP